MIDHRLVKGLTYLLCIAVLIWPSLYNGYPILYSDSGTYILSGMLLETPADRPITYGLFIRSTSLDGYTLWTTILCQAALVLRLLELLLRRILPVYANRPEFLVLLVVMLSGLTGLPWVVSQIMADIFTPIMVLCAFLLFLPALERVPKYQRSLLYLLFLFSVAAHLSHPVQVVLLMPVLLLIRWGIRKWTGSTVPISSIGCMLGLAVLSYPVMMSAVSKSGNVLFMGALAEHGVAKAFLDEHCASEDYKLCAWKDRLPKRAFEFHWDPDGPMSSYSGWPEASDEFGTIIRATLMDPKYLALHVRTSLLAMIAQLDKYAIGDGWGSFKQGSSVHDVLSKYLPHDLAVMKESRQYNAHMEIIPKLVPIHAWVVRISLAAIALLMLLDVRVRRTDLVVLIVVSVCGVVLNAWGSGTFSGEVDRFGCKMIWLLPMLATLTVMAWLNLGKGVAANAISKTPSTWHR